MSRDLWWVSHSSAQLRMQPTPPDDYPNQWKRIEDRIQEGHLAGVLVSLSGFLVVWVVPSDKSVRRGTYVTLERARDELGTYSCGMCVNQDKEPWDQWFSMQVEYFFCICPKTRQR